MAIISKPFERIAMDLIGPLSKTKRRKRFVLVVSDYATRYSEAFALRDGTAPVVHIAEKLVEYFSRYGIPKEVSDQGANFMSDLLKVLHAMLGIILISTSPYQPADRWSSGKI